MTKLRVATLCSGMDTQCMALDKLGVDYDLALWSEFDPESKKPIEKQSAVIAHNAVYPQYAGRNYGDMTKIDWDSAPDFDLLFTSTPCQSISNVGKRKGIVEGPGTRSSIMWFSRNAILTKKPKYIIMENVNSLVQKANIAQFRKWTEELEPYGYDVYSRVLNSCDFNVPQTRKRVFIVAIRSDLKQAFDFPAPVKLERRISDIAEKEVPLAQYLRKEQVEAILKHCDRKIKEGCGFQPQFRTAAEIATAITTRYGGRETDTRLKEVFCLGYTRDRKGVVTKYSPRTVANTVHCSTGSGRNTDCLVLEPMDEKYNQLVAGGYINIGEGGGRIICSKKIHRQGAVPSDARARTLYRQNTVKQYPEIRQKETCGQRHRS